MEGVVRQQALARQLALRAFGVGLLAAALPLSSHAQTTPADGANSVAHPELWPQGHSPVPMDDTIERRVRELMATMTVEEKVAQTVQADIDSITPAELKQYRLGSILAGGSSDPDKKKDAPPAAWLALADAFYRASMDTSQGRKAIPVIFGIDAVHGHNNVVGATLFPHNIGLGATRDPELMRQIAEITATELRVTGMEWTFAPTVTVPRDDRWGRAYEGFSENPEVVGSYATALVEGFQGKAGTPQFLDGHHVLATAKHYLADGGTLNGKDQGDAPISETELRDIHGAGYFPAINAGVQAVMPSYSSWNGQKMSGNRSLLVDVLRGRLGFEGFTVSDWNAHGQLPGCTNTDCTAAFNAGIDMMMTPASWRDYYTSMVRHVRAGRVSMARLDEAVARILRAKFRLGLFDVGAPSQRPLGGQFELLAKPEHRAVARRAVRESLVLIKNNGGVLPIDPRQHVLVAGDGADNIGKQAGGWTLDWQGVDNNPAYFPRAQSIWAGLREQILAAGGTATLSVDGSFTTKPDVAIVVFGEEPYAEFRGDLANLAYKPGDERDLNLLKQLRASGVPVVAVFLSGRPLWVNREINASNAFVAAWLPGSEGGGVADVLLRKADGAIQNDFHGKLSFSWPRTPGQAPQNVGAPNYDPLFAFGYGLDYTQAQELAALPEASDIDTGQAPSGVYFDRGVASKGWRVELIGADGARSTLTTTPASTADKALRVSAIDYRAQEDARRFIWAGGRAAGVAITRDDEIDLGRETNGDVSLVLTLRVNHLDKKPVMLRLDCGRDCGGAVAIDGLLSADQQWRTLSVPLNCFRAAGAVMARVTTPARIDTTGKLDMAISRVALGTSADRALDCRK